MGANQKNKRHKPGRRAGKSAREKHADAKGGLVVWTRPCACVWAKKMARVE